MHGQARDYVARAFDKFGPFATVVEFGSLDVNGAIRDIFTGAEYVGVDLVPGAGTDVVADAATWQPQAPVDCVVCCEVLEHTPDWRQIITNAHDALTDGGMLIVTAAGPGRGPHSAVDGNALRPAEHYENIDPAELHDALTVFQWAEVEVEGVDVRATAVK